MLGWKKKGDSWFKSYDNGYSKRLFPKNLRKTKLYKNFKKTKLYKLYFLGKQYLSNNYRK